MSDTIPPPPEGYLHWFDFCLKNHEDPVCDPNIIPSFYGYRLSLAANAALLGLFGASFLAYIVTYAVTRRGLAFTLAFAFGIILEILGYGGRIMSALNQWDENGFLMQICCLTIGPAFLAGGIYLCLRRIVYAFGPENSRIKPEVYTRFFIPCDLISLILQAVGGALASTASHNNEPTETGDRIMIAGLAFQVLTLLIFIIVTLDFALRVVRRRRALGAEHALDQSATAVATRRSLRFRGFLAALALATVCIFWRSVFRVAELSQGWDGPLMKRQGLFIGFEGVMIIVACLGLNVFHPSFCFKEMMGAEAQGGLGARKRARKQAVGSSEGEKGEGADSSSA